MLPEAKKLLEAHGFAVEVKADFFAYPWTPLRLVTATKSDMQRLHRLHGIP
jgi:hypothetical protein